MTLLSISALPSQVTAAYNSHTEVAIHTGCKEKAFASLLPCIWIYNEVDKYLKTIAEMENNPYREWIDEYGNEEFILSKIDKHLDFQVGIYCSKPVDGWQDASVTTVVKFNNFQGRLYFIGIWMFHKLLVGILFRKAVR